MKNTKKMSAKGHKIMPKSEVVHADKDKGSPMTKAMSDKDMRAAVGKCSKMI